MGGCSDSEEAEAVAAATAVDHGSEQVPPFLPHSKEDHQKAQKGFLLRQHHLMGHTLSPQLVFKKKPKLDFELGLGRSPGPTQ